MRLILAAIGFGLCLFLAACSTMSEAECRAGDWRSAGISDGERGLPPSWGERAAQACARYGVTLDQSAYEAGRQAGVGAYCTLDRAERDGIAGRRYYNVCTGEVGRSFERVYYAALDIAEIDEQLDRIDDSLSRLYARIGNLPPEQQEAIIAQGESNRANLEGQRTAAEARLFSIKRQELVRLRGMGVRI